MTSITAVANANSNASTITVPATTQTGDIIVIADGPNTSGTTPPTAVVPVGYTQIADNNCYNGTSNSRQIVSYKIAGPSDAGATVTGMTGGNNSRKVIAVWRGNNPITTVNTNSVVNAILSSATTNTITSSSGPAPMIILGANRGNGASGTFTYGGTLKSSGTTITTSSAAAHDVTYLISNTVPTNYTYGYSAFGTGCSVVQSFYLTFN